MRKATEDSLWAKADRSGGERSCWPWGASTFPDGSGACKYHGEQWHAHRLAYMLAHGGIPKGLVVSHTCGNPLCINPSHLFLETRLDNAASMKKALRDRFWERVDQGAPDACWLWTGTVHHSGRGIIWVSDGRRAQIASRVAWELTNGPIPEGMLVCHHCDNPLCVNPAHLFLGTSADNSADMVRKGRQAIGDRSGPRLYPERRRRGESHPDAKLTEEDVRTIRQWYANGGVLQREIGDRYGISQANVSAILLRKTWEHI